MALALDTTPVRARPGVRGPPARTSQPACSRRAARPLTETSARPISPRAGWAGCSTPPTAVRWPSRSTTSSPRGRSCSAPTTPRPHTSSGGRAGRLRDRRRRRAAQRGLERPGHRHLSAGQRPRRGGAAVLARPRVLGRRGPPRPRGHGRARDHWAGDRPPRSRRRGVRTTYQGGSRSPRSPTPACGKSPRGAPWRRRCPSRSAPKRRHRTLGDRSWNYRLGHARRQCDQAVDRSLHYSRSDPAG